MQTKKIIRVRRIWALLIPFLFLCSCRSSKEVRIGFIIHSLANVRWQTDMIYLNERATEKNAKLLVRVADDDENKQLAQARELLAEGIDVLVVVAANQNSAAGIVRAAHDYDVPVISYDRFIMNSDLDYLVSFEYEEVGRLMIEYATSLKPSGNYVFLWGEPSDANAVFIKNGHMKALEGYNRSNEIKIYHRAYIEGWALANANYEMERLMQFGTEKIDAVIASNANLAYSAATALEKYNQLDGVAITAQDLSLDTYKLIKEGKQSMTVHKPIKDLAYAAIDLAIDLGNGRKVDFGGVTKNNGRRDVPALLLKPIVIDRSNIDEVVRSQKIFTEEELSRISVD